MWTWSLWGDSVNRALSWLKREDVGLRQQLKDLKQELDALKEGSVFMTVEQVKALLEQYVQAVNQKFADLGGQITALNAKVTDLTNQLGSAAGVDQKLTDLAAEIQDDITNLNTTPPATPTTGGTTP